MSDPLSGPKPRKLLTSQPLLEGSPRLRDQVAPKSHRLPLGAHRLGGVDYLIHAPRTEHLLFVEARPVRPLAGFNAPGSFPVVLRKEEQRLLILLPRGAMHNFTPVSFLRTVSRPASNCCGHAISILPE